MHFNVLCLNYVGNKIIQTTVSSLRKYLGIYYEFSEVVSSEIVLAISAEKKISRLLLQKSNNFNQTSRRGVILSQLHFVVLAFPQNRYSPYTAQLKGKD